VQGKGSASTSPRGKNQKKIIGDMKELGGNKGRYERKGSRACKREKSGKKKKGERDTQESGA